MAYNDRTIVFASYQNCWIVEFSAPVLGVMDDTIVYNYDYTSLTSSIKLGK